MVAKIIFGVVLVLGLLGCTMSQTQNGGGSTTTTNTTSGQDNSQQGQK